MSPIEKIQSQNRRQLLHSFMVHALTALACSFIFSTFSSSSSLKHLSLTSLPQIWSSMFSPKFLFVVVNVIVVFLVGESKIGTTKSCPCPADNIYKEYVERSKSQRRRSSPRGEKKVKDQVQQVPALANQVYEMKPEISTNKVEATEKPVGGDMVIMNKKATGEKERGLLGAEELNKRAEQFIARVNKQRKLEQYSLL